MLDKVKAVIFDLDGTLVDSMWVWHDIDVEYLGRFGLSLPEDYQSCIEGMSFTETAVYTKERFAIPDSLEQMMKDWNDMAWEFYLHKVPLKTGVMEFLQNLKSRGIKMGIATSNSRELVDAITKALHIEEYMSCIITGCEVKQGKPAPDVYLEAAKVLGVSPKECLVFEDVLAGIMAGKNAGMRVCAIADEYSKLQVEQKRELADYFIEDYTQIKMYA